jgi:hypothetical protein
MSSFWLNQSREAFTQVCRAQFGQGFPDTTAAVVPRVIKERTVYADVIDSKPRSSGAKGANLIRSRRAMEKGKLIQLSE